MTEKVAPHKTRLSSEERKLSIVQAAIRLFAEKGFRGTTTREIAAAVGVSEPVLYEHFRTKRDLYAAIIDTASNGGTQELIALIGRYRDADDDQGFFNELAALILFWYSEGADLIRLLLFSNLENHELKDLFFERKSSLILNNIAEYIDSRVRKGTMRPVNPGVAAHAFLGMVSNYAMYRLVFRCPQTDWTSDKEADEVVREMVRIFLGGLCQQEQTA